MSDTTDAAVDEGLVERLTEDAVRCSGADECVTPLMYCAFGPAYRCDEIAALWLRVVAERDALLAEHEAWTKWREGEQSTSRNDWNRLTSAHDNAERVMGGE